MNEETKVSCSWCQSKDTYLMGAESWITFWHCASCSADFQVDNRIHAWNEEELKNVENE